LDMVAEPLGSRHAVTLGAHALSYEDIARSARQTATWVGRFRANTLGFIGENSEAMPIGLFGAAFASLPFAPLNYRWNDDQLRSAAARLAPAVVISDAFALERLGNVDGVTLVETTSFLKEIQTESASSEVLVAADDAPAVLLFTSGTTADPKIAVLRHENLTAYILASVDFLGAAEDEANLVSMPAYHVAGVTAVLSSTFGGRRIVYLAAFDPGAWVSTADEQAVTHAMVVPTMLSRVTDELERRPEIELPALRQLSYGGGRMPRPLIERAMERLPHVDFVNAYGLTETSSTISILDADDHRQALTSPEPAIRRRLTSVGLPVPSVAIQIRSHDGSPLDPCEPGEIWVSGDQISGDYIGVSSARGPDGWLRTNDAGWLDNDGYLFVDGRLDDVVVRGGENISPGEIEDVLVAHPAVADAAIIGIPDDEWGETVVAVVVTDGDADVDTAKLQQWVRERLRSSKVPNRIEFRSSLPYNDTGKLVRRQLRAELLSS
jgi:fatty-acyl-CoA synthase